MSTQPSRADRRIATSDARSSARRDRRAAARTSRRTPQLSVVHPIEDRGRAYAWLSMPKFKAPAFWGQLNTVQQIGMTAFGVGIFAVIIS